MDYLPQFKIWLQTKGYSDSTSRNYLVDLGKYLNYVNRLPQKVSLDIPAGPEPVEGHIFSPGILSLYVSYLSDKNNASRYLASLNRFCQFALDQHLISTNPLKNIHRAPSAPSLSELVSLYEQYLTTHNAPISTIRNYTNDLHQYISWLEINPDRNLPLTPPLTKGGEKNRNFSSIFFNLPFLKGRNSGEHRKEGFKN
jgi:site-specific recombinase XerD